MTLSIYSTISVGVCCCVCVWMLFNINFENIFEFKHKSLINFPYMSHTKIKNQF